ncbi:hypothetical protein CMQ_3000 [Grosmannia clavigera kw1407]|uniref:Uncharacterized protein n=1 Tax=Grosmannia clavigera (strain kw1407 / UAMH 11150) TaxID=655863 RepID=F0XHF7_GROCL|nr:uncharacterized protein CMQ_3000 [Grosmannia clavigera kw1407]EFX03071.1 hypothetical protein CMQ_3000 [Grosmannia clavigera kw1407]
MEMCTRLWLGPSTHRDSLIEQARNHYDQAARLICHAEESVLSRSRPNSAMSSVSSLHSPSGSIGSSRAWTPETAFSSPTASVCSSEDLIARSQQSLLIPDSPPPRPARKKVSFELPQETTTAPKGFFVRPDSPTLGFDDEYFTSALGRSTLPEVPNRPQTPECAQPDSDAELTPRALKEQAYIFDSDRDHIRDSFLMHSSEHRYCLHLAEIKKRRKARIARLRRNGWQRKRFDPSRYEALRMSALAELD